MSEKDALAYSRFLRSSVSGYLTSYFELASDDSCTQRTTTDILLCTKGQVSDGIFERQRAIVEETDSTILALSGSLRLAKFRLSKFFIGGPDEDVKSYRSEIDSLSRLINRLETDLSRISASFRRRQDYRNVNIDRIQAGLPENSVLVEFVKYDYQQLVPDSAIARYLAVVIGKNDRPLIVNLGDASSIDSVVNRYRNHILRTSGFGKISPAIQAVYRKLARSLYTRVWAPIEWNTAGRQLVLIAPDGALNLVSFAGLIDAEGRYLIEEHPIHYLSCGRDLIRLGDDHTPGRGLFALGDPDYDRAASTDRHTQVQDKHKGSSSSFSAAPGLRLGGGKLKDISVFPLPGTRREVKQIAKKWEESTGEPVTICLGSNATEGRFKANAPGHRVIHVATHGYYIADSRQPAMERISLDSEVGYGGENPLLLSGLFFAGVNDRGGAEGSEGEDGILTAYEVSSTNLKGAELVVLSACETSLGEVMEGEGVYGLRRAFQMAGARTVISALWPVSDDWTAEMMSRLYDAGTESLPETMQRVQLDRIEQLRSLGQPDHPFSWAGFIALGDFR
jgi:CHAT domain-containing protein